MSLADDIFAAADEVLDNFFGGQIELVFSRHDGTLDSSGQPTLSVDGDWDVVATVDGFFEVVGAGRAMHGKQIATADSAVITCDYDAEIVEGLRVVPPDGSVWYVTGVRDPSPHADKQKMVVTAQRSRP